MQFKQMCTVIYLKFLNVGQLSQAYLSNAIYSAAIPTSS